MARARTSPEAPAGPDDGGLGRRIRALRLAKGYTLKQVAALAGLSPSFVSMLENGKTVDDVLADAQKSKIPVYLIKIGGNIQNKRSVADELWIGAVKKTGGEFFSGGDEATIIRAIQAIDRRAAGKIEMKQYSTERPRYAPFAMTAALLWCAALILRFTIPTFQTFP